MKEGVQKLKTQFTRKRVFMFCNENLTYIVLY